MSATRAGGADEAQLGSRGSCVSPVDSRRSCIPVEDGQGQLGVLGRAGMFLFDIGETAPNFS